MSKSIRLLAALLLLGGLVIGVFGVASAEAPVVAPAGTSVFLPAVDDNAIIQVQNLAPQGVEAQFQITYEYGSPASVLGGVVNGGSSWTFMPDASRAPAQGAPLSTVPQGSARVYQVGPTVGDQLIAVPFAVTVDRKGTSSGAAPAVPGGGNGSYTGVSLVMLPRMEGDFSYWIYAPIINKNYGGWNSIIRVMNVQAWPAQFDIWFYDKFGTPVSAITNYQLSAVDTAGASVAIDPAYPPAGVPDGTYSAWIRMTSNDPSFGGAAAVVDVFKTAFGSQVVSTYRATPWQNAAANPAIADLTNLMTGEIANYAPLVFKAYNDWNAAVRVVNTSPTTHAKVKVTFRDGDGTAVATLVDDIDRQSYKDYPFRDLSVIPQNFVGSATVESQVYDPAGGNTGPEPVISVVAQTKWAAGDAADDLPRLSESYNTINFDQGTATKLGAPYVSRYANDGFSSGLSVMNMNRQPGTTDFTVNLFTAAGRIWSVDLTSSELDAKQLDLRNISDDMIPHGFSGSATVVVTGSTQLGGAYIGGIVSEVSFADASDGGKAYEMTPVPIKDIPVGAGCIKGQVTLDGVPVVGAQVDLDMENGNVHIAYATTDATGDYEFTGLEPGTYFVQVQDLGLVSEQLKIVANNGVCETMDIPVELDPDGGTFVKDFLVTDAVTGDAISGAVVDASSEAVAGFSATCTTNANGACDIVVGPDAHIQQPFTPSPLGPWTFTVDAGSAYGDGSGSFTAVAGETETNAVSLTMIKAVCGTVTGNVNGLLQAISNETVTLTNALTSAVAGTDVTNSDGKYCIDATGVDKAFVSTPANGFDPFTSAEFVVGSGITTKDIELVPAK